MYVSMCVCVGHPGAAHHLYVRILTACIIVYFCPRMACMYVRFSPSIPDNIITTKTNSPPFHIPPHTPIYSSNPPASSRRWRRLTRDSPPRSSRPTTTRHVQWLP